MALSVMTVNLFNGRAEPKALREVLMSEKPDIVACQELSQNAAAVLDDLYPHGHLDPRDDNHGGGIVARRPISVEPLPVAPRPGWSVTLYPTEWPGLLAPLAVTSVHFTNPVEWPWKQSLNERRGQVGTVIAHVEATRLPHLVVGDFNASPAWPAYRQITRALTDGPRSAGTARRTWGPSWWFPRLLRIDHGFVKGIDVVSSRTIGIRGTDHSALVLQLDLSD